MNKNIVIALLIIIIVVLGFLALKPKYDAIKVSPVSDVQNDQSMVDSNRNDIQPKPVANSAKPSECTLISPNGGEIYSKGQQIKITWNPCNTSGGQVMITLKSSQTGFGAEIATVPDTGSATISLPTVLGGGQAQVVSGKYYKINLQFGGAGMGARPPIGASDNFFTIQ